MNFLFELMLVAKPLDEAEIEKVINNVKNIVDKNFGIIKRVHYLGHKRLTYTIKKFVRLLNSKQHRDAPEKYSAN